MNLLEKIIWILRERPMSDNEAGSILFFIVACVIVVVWAVLNLISQYRPFGG